MGWINVASVEFVEATHRYPGNRAPAVDKLDLTVESGEFMVLLGASGSGKTTALRMLAGLETVDSGAVYIDGRDVSDLEPGERDRILGLRGVQQGFSLLLELLEIRALR